MLDSILEKVRSIIREELSSFYQEDSGEEVEAELILLYHPECPSCKEVLEGLKEAIDAGAIRKVNIMSVEGKNIAFKLDNFAVPQLVAKVNVAKVNGQYKPCTAYIDGEDLIIDCEAEIKKK